MLPLAEAGIISTSLQGMLYGVSILMFILTGWILLRNRRRRRTNRSVMTAGICLFCLCTVIFAINITRLREGLLTVGPDLPGGAEQYFSDVSQPTFVIKSTLYNVQTLILDGVVIYRAYIAWQRWCVVLVPMLGWLGLLATTVGNNITLATPATTSSNVFAVRTGSWITAVYSTTLATNLTATGLLAWRIWRVSCRAATYVSSDRLNTILGVVIESGAIYSVTIIAALICFVIGSPGVYVLLDLLSPLICIVFNMIIVRVGLATDHHMSPPQMDNGVISGLQFAGSSEQSRHRDFMPGREGGETKSLAVRLTHDIDTDCEMSSVVDRDSKTQRELGCSEEARDSQLTEASISSHKNSDRYNK